MEFTKKFHVDTVAIENSYKSANAYLIPGSAAWLAAGKKTDSPGVTDAVAAKINANYTVTSDGKSLVPVPVPAAKGLSTTTIIIIIIGIILLFVFLKKK